MTVTSQTKSRPDTPLTVKVAQVQVQPPTTASDTDHPWGLFPLGAQLRCNRFQTVIRQSALNAMHQHGMETPDIEVCGAMIGGVYRDDFGEYLHVRHVIRGEGATATAGSVTFTSETWTYIHKQIDEHYPNDRILGWYHTHPNHGIFLSSMDKFIHENFFNLRWQVAYVHDPIQLSGGLFRWKANQVRSTRYLIEADHRPVGALNRDYARDRERKLLIWVVTAIVALALCSVAVVWSQASPAENSKVGATESGGIR